jgi:hypothetical protein
VTRAGRLALALGALLAGAGGAARAQELVQLRRYSDVVAVRTAPGERERVLYYFAPIADLQQGGHVEQGSGGHSELYLSGGARVSLRASGHAILERISAEGDVLRFPILTMVEVKGGSRPLDLELPGGVSCRIGETAVVIEQLPKRLRVRNQVGEKISVVGPPPAVPYELLAGQEVVFPLLDTPLPEAQTTVAWGDLSVRFAPGVQVSLEEQWLRVERAAEGQLHAEAPVSVGGVATRPGEGRLVVYNPRPAAAKPPVPPEPPASTETSPQPQPEPETQPAEPVEPPPAEETQR